MTAPEVVKASMGQRGIRGEIEDKLRALIDRLQAKDLDALSRMYAPDVVSFDVEPPLQHVGIAAKLRNWERAFAVFDSISYELRDLRITAAEDLAFGYGFGRLSGTLATGATTPGMWVRATFCFARIDGDWLVVHDQVSVPLDPAIGRAVTDLEP
jgi:ketosteroid isomerase-like protein